MENFEIFSRDFVRGSRDNFPSPKLNSTYLLIGNVPLVVINSYVRSESFVTFQMMLCCRWVGN